MSEKEIGKYIQIVSRQIKRNMDETLNCYQVTGVQSMIIRYIYLNSEKREIYAKDIEEEFDIRKATIAGIIQLMEINGLIQRESKQGDSRLKKIVLTPKALKIQKEIEKQIECVESKIVMGMSLEEKESLLMLLKKASDNLCHKNIEESKNELNKERRKNV